MKAADLKGKTKDEMEKQILALRKEQLNLRLQKTAGTLETTARFRAVRRDIARLKTALTALEKGTAEGGKPAAKKAAKTTAKKKAA
ncbi:MAG: 50S ribosomal protein L29 [Alphaproteobacteria bacterium]|nr:50S ribosomal protein L29 [Alphaproteobacteria bacterium]